MLQIHDIVALHGGRQIIITDIKFNRPANPYCGVLINGLGKEYKFGPKHMASQERVGIAASNHPALNASVARKTPAPVEALAHKAYCEQCAGGWVGNSSFAKLAQQWRTLGNTPIGGTITIMRRGRPEPWTLQRVMYQGQRFNFVAANENGTAYKWDIGVIA